TLFLLVGYIDSCCRIRCARARCVQMPRLGSSGSDLLNEAAILVVLRDARVGIAVGGKNVPFGVPRNIGWPGEAIWLRWRRRRAGRRGGFETLGGFSPSAHNHKNAAFGAELHHDVGAFIDRPDIVLRINTDSVRHFESVQALPAL